jgi:hypothetical protein
MLTRLQFLLLPLTLLWRPAPRPPEPRPPYTPSEPLKIRDPWADLRDHFEARESSYWNDLAAFESWLDSYVERNGDMACMEAIAKINHNGGLDSIGLYLLVQDVLNESKIVPAAPPVETEPCPF